MHSNFERWNPPDGTSFDLVYAATAWGWIDPVVKYAKAAALLRPGGHLAAWAAEHGMPEGFDPFFTDIQAVYNEIGEGHPGPWPPPIPDEVPDDSAAFEESDWFDVVAVRRYVWAIDYDADGYLALLNTFSGHIAMDPAKRAHLYDEIRRRLTARPSGTVHRHWVAVMTVGRRR